MKRVSTSRTGVAVAFGIGILGSLIYAIVVSDVFWPNLQPAFGGKYFDVYNRYFLSIIDGRLDLPMRVLRVEGHYLQDGTGYLYHGVGPLLTRFLVGWLVPLDQFSLIGPSIWLWAVAGTTIYHVLLYQTFCKYGAGHVRHPIFWITGISVAIWFASPGLLLVSNRTLTHETISLAYALTAGFIYCLAQAALFGRPMRAIIVPLAVFAALTVHARPNVALGLYVGVAVLGLAVLAKDRLRSLLPVFLAGVFLGLSGLAYLGINNMKFGDMAELHGSYLPGPVQYGTVFWGEEAVDSPRASAFIEHGQFNISRIGPNLALYVFDPPGTSLQVAAHDWYERVTSRLGHIRVEWAPGIAFLWLPWCLGAMFLVTGARRETLSSVSAGLSLLCATLFVALLIASYGTHTLRYRIELWPLLISILLLAAPSFRRVFSEERRWAGQIIAICVVASIVITTRAVWFNRQTYFRDFEWTEAYCEQLVAKKDFQTEPIENICRV